MGLGISASACGWCHACACVFMCICMLIHMCVGISWSKKKLVEKKLRIASASEKVFARICGRFIMYLGHSKTCVFRRRRCEIYDCDTPPYLRDIWTYNIDRLEWSYNTTESDLISLNPFCYTLKVLNWTSYSCLLQVFEQN